MVKQVKTSLTGFEDRDLPVVALVGRPNVGKSTLFNRLTKSRRAIIDPTPGMTRDLLYGTIQRDAGSYRLADTGGLEDRADRIAAMIRHQTDQAIQQATVIVFMIDGQEGVLAGDRAIVDALRQCGKPVILFVNKMDSGDHHMADPEIYGLGFQGPVFGAAEHGRGTFELLETIDESMEGKWTQPKQAPEEPPVRLAIIGRPNVGKSSLLNKFLHEERVMVSDIAGTTRDPIDTYLNYNQRTFCLVDTAGIRKRGRIEGSQEHLSVLMAKRQVESADVTVLLIDAADPLAAQDAAIGGLADKAFKPVIVAVNKWDLVAGKTTGTAKDFEMQIRRRMKFLETAPFVFVSAKTGQRVSKILEMAANIVDRMETRVTTGVLNRFVADMSNQYRIPTHKGRAFKIFYMTQVETKPPTFVIVINRKEPLHYSQERFLVNRIREAFHLEGIPLKLKIKPRKKE